MWDDVRVDSPTCMCVCLYVCIHTLIHAHTEASIHTGVQYTRFLKANHGTTQSATPVAG